jgi:flavin reductase
MSVDASEFKQCLKLWASGITVVTCGSETEEPKGMTVTAFSSVSADPAQILVCLNQATDTGAMVLKEKRFAVNLLKADQESLSNQFAGGASQQERFATVKWQSGMLNQPILLDTLASLECTVVEHVQAGSHWIVIGEVQSVTCREGNPLLYFNSAYREIKA